MQLNITLSPEQVADLRYVVSKTLPPVVTGEGEEQTSTPAVATDEQCEAYLRARIDDLLASYSRVRLSDRAAENEALIKAALALPEDARNRIKAAIAAELQPAN